MWLVSFHICLFFLFLSEPSTCHHCAHWKIRRMKNALYIWRSLWREKKSIRLKSYHITGAFSCYWSVRISYNISRAVFLFLFLPRFNKHSSGLMVSFRYPMASASFRRQPWEFVGRERCFLFLSARNKRVYFSTIVLANISNRVLYKKWFSRISYVVQVSDKENVIK